MYVDPDGKHITTDGTSNGFPVQVPFPYGPVVDMFVHNHPENDNIPKGMCLFSGEVIRSERQYNNRPDQCTIGPQTYCTYKCHSGRTKSYPKTTTYVPCLPQQADAPPYD